MELKKKKYTRTEVENLLEQNNEDVMEKLLETTNRASLLEEENKKLLIKLTDYINRENIISSSIKDSEEKAKEIEDNALCRYEMGVETLKVFFEKWKGYFDMLKEKYPLYSATNRAEAIREKFYALLKTGDNKAIIDELNNTVSKKEYNTQSTFNPKQKINDYIAATSDNGFNLDEVLNPGELQLEDLCKELGLMEEE